MFACAVRFEDLDLLVEALVEKAHRGNIFLVVSLRVRRQALFVFAETI